MSETPRTDAFLTEQGLNFGAIDPCVSWMKKLESELAAMTAERDALKELDAIASSIEWCMRLSESVKEGETMVQWVKRMFDATARAEIAERQVAMLCGHIEDYGSCWNCPAKSLGAACSYSGESCRDALAAWYRAEAVKEGGKG